MERIIIYWAISMGTLTLVESKQDDYGFNHDRYKYEKLADTLKKEFTDPKKSFEFYKRMLLAKDSIDKSAFSIDHVSGFRLSRSIDSVWVEIEQP